MKMLIQKLFITLLMDKMDNDKDGKVLFEDFQATVSIADICERDAF